MPGVIITVNELQIAAVSTDGLNIVVVNISGDVLGEEFSTINMHGGLYGEGDNDKHLIWLNDRQIFADDVVKIEFVESVGNSHEGKTIEEAFPEKKPTSASQESLEDIFNDLSSQEKVRNGFEFVLSRGDELIRAATKSDDFSFHFGVMWRWVKVDELKISLSSNSLVGIKEERAGTKHCDLRLLYGQSTTLEIRSI